MYKIAVCLHGYFNKNNFPLGKESGYEYLNEMFKNLDVNYFIHSWEPNLKNNIISFYNPKKYIFEPQIDFENIIKNNNLGHPNLRNDWLKNSMSYSYSRSNSIQLKIKYELENNIQYDCVVICRFDIGKQSEISKLIFDIKKDMDYIYCKWWNQLNNGLAEQWFYSNSNNINVISNLYSRYFIWFRENSKYYNTLLKWPDSNSYNQFSNEVELPPSQKHDDLQKIDIEYAANNHVIYKYFFIEQNLYHKLVFLK